MHLNERRVLLTGASGGIGLAAAWRLAEAGARLLLVARRCEALRPLAERFPGRITLLRADLTDPAGRAAIAAEAERLGGIEVLINAAGIGHFGAFEQLDEADIAALMQLNVTATLQLTRLLLPQLQRQPQALLVNVGSIFGSIGHPGFAAYCASKFALHGFSQALRRELADGPVRVLHFAPRATRTSMNSAPAQALNEALGNATDTPEQVAGQLLRAIEQERRETWLGWPEKLFVRLNALFPGLVDRALRQKLATILRHARHR
ncbi:SDR family oxidoreductase [Pseudomonas mangrovi]|uniref:Short chain dehydrogenase n=1 Tax=Pseudomonas mangrovi TaxID=2161748 RepID=A0A2T5PEM4_9PSED|nr:SDR family oxidoreductase [Pseudomonas mangrovi]PTU76186.1 short chain dehydrogenase [Pseudomonas mangrovi]